MYKVRKCLYVLIGGDEGGNWRRRKVQFVGERLRTRRLMRRRSSISTWHVLSVRVVAFESWVFGCERNLAEAGERVGEVEGIV